MFTLWMSRWKHRELDLGLSLTYARRLYMWFCSFFHAPHTFLCHFIGVSVLVLLFSAPLLLLNVFVCEKNE